MPNLSDLIGGGGGGPTEIGSNYASGTVTATIVSAASNTAGVEIRTLCLQAVALGGRFAQLKVGTNVIAKVGPVDDSGAASAIALTNIFVPPGLDVICELSSAPSPSRFGEYHITYEVL